MQVEEDGHRLLGHGRQRLHGPEGVALALVQDLAVGVDPAARHRPRHHAPAGDPEGPEVPQQALLLVGGDSEGGIAGPQVVPQVLGKRGEHDASTW